MSTQDLLRAALQRKPKVALDSTAQTLDMTGDYTDTDISLKALNMVTSWLDSNDMDEGENCADRLLALMVGVFDADKDGEITGDEQDVLDIALNSVWEYLTQNGIDEEDASLLLNDWDEDAAIRIKDMLGASMDDEEGAVFDSIESFAFGVNADGATLDAVYKKTIAVRGGKKVRINKRISGTVRLSAKQKMAIRKAGKKSHNAAAMMKRAKSMRLRKKSNLK